VTTQIKRLVSHLTAFSEQDWSGVQHLIRTATYKKGERFLSIGDPCDRFGVVEEGIFRIYYIDVDGKDAIKTFRSQGAFIGSYAEFLRGIPSRLCVEALSDSVLSVVQADDMMETFKKSGPWEQVGRKIAEQLYLEKEEREYQFLCMDAAKRYEAFLRKYADCHERIPDYMVASYLGITPVYLSKLKKEK
jgi:CRP-like cAMP-binding protein